MKPRRIHRLRRVRELRELSERASFARAEQARRAAEAAAAEAAARIEGALDRVGEVQSRLDLDPEGVLAALATLGPLRWAALQRQAKSVAQEREADSACAAWLAARSERRALDVLVERARAAEEDAERKRFERALSELANARAAREVHARTPDRSNISEEP